MQYFNGLLTRRPAWFLFVSLAGFTYSVQAEQITESQSDCGEVDIRYADDPTLTRAEKLQLMEKAFFDSLSRFEMCNISNESSSNAEQDSASTAGGGAGQGSVASSDMEGSETPDVSAAASGAQAFEENDNALLETPPPLPSGGASNGAIPDDIPPANNDDAIAAQIRLAAERETDPDIQKRLWNEYRKYKGLKIEQ